MPLVGYFSGGEIEDFVADERFVYLLLGQELAVLDFRATVAPQRVGFLLLTEVYHKVYIAGTFLYVWRNGKPNSLLVVDVSDPTGPRPIQQYEGAHSLLAEQGEGVVYAHNQLGMWWEMPAVADSLTPILLDHAPTLPPADTLPPEIAGTFDAFTTALKTNQLPNTTYVLTGETMGPLRLVAYDTSDPAQFTQLTHYQAFGSMAQLVYQDGVLIGGGLGHAGGSLHRFDLSDPSQPTYVETVPLAANGFALVEQFLFVGNTPGILTYDLSTSPMQMVGSYTTNLTESKAWMAGRTHILPSNRGDRLVAVFGFDVGDGGGLELVNAGNPAQLQTIALYPPDLPANNFFGIDDIAQSNEMLFVSKDRDIAFFDLSGQGEMVNAGNLYFSTPTNHQIAAHQTALYLTDVADAALFIQVADVSNPADPQLLNPLPSCPANPTATNPHHAEIMVDANKLYWLTDLCGLQIFDLSDPYAPVWLTTLPVQGRTFTVGDGLIILQGKGQGLLIIAAP
jgi:hypothetical protein